jgi:hypothetical protein
MSPSPSPPPTDVRALANPRVRTRILAAAAIALAGAWLWGLAGFLRAAPFVSVTLPRQADPPADEHNLASWRWGPTVRASSYHRDPFAQHHPAFLVDERLGPSLIEKWASADGDRQPWVEITWREPRALARVVVRHAGEYESDGYTLAKYTLTCLRSGGPGRDPTLATTAIVTDNKSRVAIHPLICADAVGVRLDAQPSAPGALVRLYEIEAWGQ